MKISNKIVAFQLLLLLTTITVAGQNRDPFEKIKSIPEKLQMLPLGEVTPSGWLKTQLQQDLDGFVGHLDSLVPDLIIKDDIYGKNRLTKKVKSKDVGAIADEGDWQVQFLWWNSETQGNWWDGYIRSAILANDLRHLERIKKYISRILATQDADGYLGIYDQELRYRFDNENGELWAKTTLLRGLLAWYEYTKNSAILSAIERAVANLMTNYPINASHPFRSIKPDVGGLSHGLTFTDVVERLYQLTGKEIYLDYSLFCYKDFSLQILNEDAQYKKLIDSKLSLKGHGVHTYEHLRSVAAAYYASGNPALKSALTSFLRKIASTTTVSGAAIGDEWISGGQADATKRGYEYCSIHELMNGYTSLLAKSGASKYGDLSERIFFNAASGARHPSESSIAYLKSDNSYYMTGGLNGDTSIKNQTRYKYSPVHQDAAVCCVPNAGRITPHFVQNMWMKDENGLVASLLGPCYVNTMVNGKKVSIYENTSYPANYTINFEIEADSVNFDLRIRKPSWASHYSANAEFNVENGFIVIRRTWKGKQTITVNFMPVVKTHRDNNKERYFTYGPLVLANSKKGNGVQSKSFPLQGFYELKYTPEKLVVYHYRRSKILQPVKNKLSFQTNLFNPLTKKLEEVTLVPMGSTILRQVTF